MAKGNRVKSNTSTSNKSSNNNIFDVGKEYKKSEKGTLYLGSDQSSKKEKEIECAKWIYNEFGGDVEVLDEINKESVKTPDFKWNDKYWELKEVSSKNSVDKNVQKALKQIGESKGGIILDTANSNLSYTEIKEIVRNRALRNNKNQNIESLDVIVKSGDNLIGIFRIKK